MQNAQIIGNIVADAENKTARDGSEYIVFRVAVNENRGEEKKTQYFDVYYQKTGVLKYLKKGQKVFIGGHLSLSATNKDGNVYVNATISAKDVELVTAQQG